MSMKVCNCIESPTDSNIIELSRFIHQQGSGVAALHGMCDKALFTALAWTMLQMAAKNPELSIANTIQQITLATATKQEGVPLQ